MNPIILLGSCGIIGLIPFSAWVTHIITCFNIGAWVFLIVGALAIPVGVIHGVGIWFGIW